MYIRSYKSYIFILGIIIVLFVVISLISRNYSLQRSIDVRNNTPLGATTHTSPIALPSVSIPMPSPDPDRFNLLILGIRGEDQPEEGGLLTDTIQVISFQRSTGKATIVAVPRDIDTQFDGVHGKLNSAYETGIANGGGIKLASQVLSKITGVYIDKTVVIDFNAFTGVVNALGGIDIHLDQPFKESAQWGYAFSLPAGDNHLNGDQALYYARSRYSSSDFDRARRQQQIMEAVKKKVVSADLLSNPSQILALYNEFKAHVRTDLNVSNISDIIRLASTFAKNSKPSSYVISNDNYLRDDRNERQEYILVPKKGPSDFSDIHAFFQSIFSNKK